MHFDIRITGNGTQAELVKALEKVVSNLKASTPTEISDAQWEDPTLMTEVWETTDRSKPEEDEPGRDKS